MSSIDRKRMVACVLLSFTLAATACSTDDDTLEVQAGLDEVVRADVAENHTIGTGVSVRLADGRVLRATVGVADPLEVVPYDVGSTEQVIGSVTKLYTTVLAMQLVEAHRIALDDRVDRWLSFAGADRITVRMLLKHTSGLNDFMNLMTGPQYGQRWSPEQLLELALDGGPVGEPGMAQAIYSNTNFLVLAMIVEAETGKSWEENLAERIARPLGLEHTYFAGDDARAANLASGWMRTDAGWLDTLTVMDPSIGWGVGGLVSTNEELRRFTEALFDGELFRSRDTLAQVLRFDTEMNPAYLGQDPPSSVGLGVIRMRVGDLRLDGHLGHALGYNAAAVRDADSGDIIVVTNNDDAAYAGFTAGKVDQYLRDL